MKSLTDVAGGVVSTFVLVQKGPAGSKVKKREASQERQRPASSNPPQDRLAESH
jgi:hypothetical protein